MTHQQELIPVKNDEIIVIQPKKPILNSIKNKQQIINTQTTQEEVVLTKTTKKESILKKNSTEKKAVAIAKNEKNTTKINDYKNPKENILVKKKSILNKEDNITKNKKQSIFSVLNKAKNAIAKSSKRDSILKNNATSKKWTITPVFAVINSKSFSNTSPIDKSLTSNSTTGKNSFSYGLKIAYQINKKWSIQSGIHLQKLDYENKNLVILSSVTDNKFSNINYIDNQTSFSLGTLGFFNDNQAGNTFNLITNNATLTQTFGYIEIPLEIKYTFINSAKFSSKIVTGISSLFLTKNEILVDSPSFSQKIGKANNLNSLNFSGNLGFDYSISNQFQLNVNPMFKVQLNTFSENSNGFKPYSIGIYTGIKYQF